MADDNAQPGFDPMTGVDSGDNSNPRDNPMPELPAEKLSDDLPSDSPPETALPEKDPNMVAGKPPEHQFEPTRHDGPMEGEVVSDGAVDDGLPESEPSAYEFKADFKDVVGSAGLSKKTCFTFLVMVLLIGAVVYYFFFAGDSDTESEEKPPTDVEEVEEPEGEVEQVVKDVKETLIPSIEYGQPAMGYQVVKNGIDAAIAVGKPKAEPSENFEGYILALQSLRNVYKTDVHAMLDASPARLNALNTHISIFEEALSDAKTGQEEMRKELLTIKEHYDATSSTKEGYEQQFFTFLGGLDVSNSNTYLEKFIEEYKEQVDYKSRYNAMAKLNELYVNALEKAGLRLEDIKANIDPLVAGVKVVDIVGSDIDLIEPEILDE
ncbi:MAG: hypothetical protein ABH856_03200 [Patescibacteria group bacterium]